MEGRSSPTEPPAKRVKLQPYKDDDERLLDASDFTDVECKEFDAKDELDIYHRSDIKPALYPYVLASVAALDEGILPKYHHIMEAKNYIFKNEFMSMVIGWCCENGKFRDVRRIKAIRTPLKPIDLSKEQKDAMVESWGCPFRHEEAVDVLKNTILGFVDKHFQQYVPCTSIVNSSGTGKSRLVDELGKDVVVVPMCLRKEGRSGFPPADGNLRNWLLQADIETEEGANKRANALVYALLVVTLEHMKKIESESGQGPQSLRDEKWYKGLASNFRERMVSGQTSSKHNVYRRDFYDRVIAEARKFEENSTIVGRNGISPGLKSANEMEISAVAEKICEFLAGDESYASLLVLSFDEYHDLAIQQNGSWSLFSCLRRALRRTRGRFIFSLFLSTAAKYQEFSPEIPLDHSARIITDALHQLPPITEVGFDMLAEPISEDQKKLNHFTSPKYMAHLGRPLFGARFDVDIKDDLMDFVIAKLTANRSFAPDASALLACLAVRFSLEFSPKTPEERIVELTQVERHMRICLSASPGFHRLVTVSASEPLLAEAASIVLPHTKVPEALAKALDTTCINRGSGGSSAAAPLCSVQTTNEVSTSCFPWFTKMIQ